MSTWAADTKKEAIHLKTLEVASPTRDCPDCPELPADHLPEAAHHECYSGKNCTGKVLSNRDAHNCKNNGGKSWRSGVTGQCHNL